MDRYIYGLILSLTLLLNTSGLVCSEQVAEKEQEDDVSKSKAGKKHRRILSTQQVEGLKEFIAMQAAEKEQEQAAEKKQEQEGDVSESKRESKTAKKHRRVLSIEQLENLEALMKTGKPGKRHAKSLTSSRQFDETEIKKLLDELDALNNPNVEQDIPDTKSE